MRSTRAMVVIGAGVLLGFVGGGSVAAGIGDTQDPGHSPQGDAPAAPTSEVADCAALALALSPSVPADTVYDPSTGTVAVYTELGAFTVSVSDRSCLAASEEVADLVDHVLAVDEENRASECKVMSAALEKAEPGAPELVAGGRSLDTERLRAYLKDIC